MYDLFVISKLLLNECYIVINCFRKYKHWKNLISRASGVHQEFFQACTFSMQLSF